MSGVQLELVFGEMSQKRNALKINQEKLKTLVEKDPEYQKQSAIVEEGQAKMKEIMIKVAGENPNIVFQIDELKSEVDAKKETMAAKAMENIKKGEETVFSDEAGNTYKAVFNVSFKKLNGQQIEKLAREKEAKVKKPVKKVVKKGKK